MKREPGPVDWHCTGLLVFALLTGCHKTVPAVPRDGEAPMNDSGTGDGGEMAPRCSVRASGDIGSPGDGQDLDVGAGVLEEGAAVLGVLRSDHGSRIASIVRFSRAGKVASSVELGRVSRGAAPPAVFTRDGETFAAGCLLPASNEEAGAPQGSVVGRLTLLRVTEKAEALATLAEPSVGSESSTVAVSIGPSGSGHGALFAWDEDAVSTKPKVSAGGTPSPRGDAGVLVGEVARGVIRVALVTSDMRSVARLDSVSPDSSDAERPQLAAREGGFWVAWVAHKAEPTRDAPAELEAPGEERAYGWVELLALDPQGKPAGPVRRLTSSSGHVSGFEMASTPQGGRLDVYVGLEDERGQGAGGAIAHVAIAPDGSPRTTSVVPEGRERDTSPWLLTPVDPTGTSGALLYVDSADHMRSVALDASGDARGPSSSEPVLDQTRPIAFGTSVRRPDGGTLPGLIEVLALATAPGGSTANPEGILRWVSCETRP